MIRKIGFIVLAIILVLVYRGWFNLTGTLSSGDWPYLYKEAIKNFSFVPDPQNFWLGLYYQIPTKIFVEYFNFPWEIAEKLLWFWPFIVISIISSYYLFRSWIGVLIYTTNTYILMVVGGGQMGVAMSYSLAPLVLCRFIAIIDFLFQEAKPKIINVRDILVTGFILSIHVMFDPRIAYITGIGILSYWIYSISINKNKSFSRIIKNSGYSFGIPVLVTFLVNSFWIIPLLAGNISFPIETLGSLSGFKFLSFADFSHALSLLHPNWPENIFGKVYFLQSEFLVLPVIAFLSLFFISYRGESKKRTVVYFAILALLGIFFAKGANPPFGGINTWIFEHIPGMGMFRDASKFYLLIVLGYAFLIPWSLKKLSQKIRYKRLFLIVFILFWCLSIRQAILGELKGTFKAKAVPAEYISLKEFLLAQPQHTSSVWIPFRQRFGFSSPEHPAISMSEVLGNIDIVLMAKLMCVDKRRVIYEKLRKIDAKYVIVPFDSEGELFIRDRKYSNLLRDKIIMELDKTEWLIKLPKFGNTVVYEIKLSI